MAYIDQSEIPQPRQMRSFQVAFSTKSDGSMERILAERKIINSNRKAFFSRLELDWNTTHRVRPSHSSNIEVLSFEADCLVRKNYRRTPLVDADFDYFYQGADGLLTLSKNASVSLVTGDCIPLVIWEEETGLHGILHVGLLPALNQIVVELKRVLKSLRIKPENINAYLGPSISKNNYDVTRSGLWDAISPQLSARPEASIYKYFDGRTFDLRGLVVDQLVQIGLTSERIGIYDPCTADSNSKYFSNYASKHSGAKPGGFCTVIW
jgi:copper oxidase (laccase) domain-containing protein